MSDILKESRVRGYYQDGDLKITIEKKGLFNKKRKVYTTFWGSRTTLVEREPEVYGWATIEFTVDDLTEDNNFGEYQKYYEAYIKERDQPKGPFKAYNSFERNNLEFSKDWNSDLDIIKLYILINTEKYKEKVYEWALLEEDIKGEKGGLAPYYRSFGSDGYYLNNGTSIRIDWIEGTYVAGNESWSDAKGNELGNQDLTRWNTKKYEKKSKGYFDKVVSGLWAPEGNPAGDSYMDFTYEKSPHFSKERLPRIKYGSSMKDTDILNQIVSYWKQEVPGYESLAILKNGHGSPAIEKNESKETLIEYKSPFGMSASGPSASGPSASGASASEPAAVGVTASSKLKPTFKGITDGFQITAKTDMPSFSIYVGDPEKWPVRENIEEEVAAGRSDGFDDVEGAEEFSEEGFSGQEEKMPELEAMEMPPTPEQAAEAASVVESLENTTPITVGNWKLDVIPGTFVTNGGTKITCCQIDGKAVNVKIAGAYLDMEAAAKKDGVNLSINSGFRSPYDSINTKSAAGVAVSSSSQKYLYDGWLARKPGFNLAAAPGGSNHGNGIGLDLNAGGKSSGRKINVNQKIYTWLVKNSWKYGFIRAVKAEEWHYDYLPDLAKKGPYGKIAGTDANKFYSDWGLDKLSIA